MVVGFDVVVWDDWVGSVESAVVCDESSVELGVFEGVVDASVSLVGVDVSSSDVDVVGGSVVDSDSDSLEDVGVASDEVGSGSEVAEVGSKSARPPEVSASCRIDNTSPTLFLAAACGPPAFWTEEM